MLIQMYRAQMTVQDRSMAAPPPKKNKSNAGRGIIHPHEIVIWPNRTPDQPRNSIGI